MRTRLTAVAMAVGLCALGAPASAQIIATSIPKEVAAGGKGGGGRFALHLMGAPLSKWKYNELVTGGVIFDQRLFLDSGFFSGTPNSKFLLAGEMVFKVTDDVSFGVGGWYNKVGKVTYNFTVDTAILRTTDFALVGTDHLTGTLDGDLSLGEGHASIFYKDFGIQGGIVHTKSKINNSHIATSDLASNIGKQLGSVEGDENTANDYDLFGVYKFGGGKSSQPWNISLGAGILRKKGTAASGQRTSEDQTVFSGFATGSVGIWKGFGIDVSYWYIGKTKATRAADAGQISDSASRFTIGASYTFSR